MKQIDEGKPTRNTRNITLKIQQLPHVLGLPLPDYQSEQAAGFDLLTAIDEGKKLILAPGARILLPTGLVFALPEGFEAQIRPRSGLALKHGVTVLNSPGTIDADYRGEIKVLLVNLGGEPFEITRGMRIAQCVVQPVSRVVFQLEEVMQPSIRGEAGFGSTGV